jgi:alpha-galactosidase
MMKKLMVFAAVMVFAGGALAQVMDRVEIAHISKDFSVKRLHDPVWQKAKAVEVTTYWSGETASEGRRFWAWLLWSDKFLYIRFVAPHAEPPVVNTKPDLSKKTIGLWERDVCEIFIAPDKMNPNKYFEFEIAPTGEWIDLGIEVTPKERLTDWKYSSRMQSAASDIKGETYAAIKIPFASLGRTPAAGDIWLGNIFRCIGKDPGRGYLAWRPTKTPEPNFHVPSAFGEFHFVK